MQKQLKNWSGLENLDLASVVSTPESYSTLEGVWNIQNNKYKKNSQHKYRITCLDFGIKKNILRNLNGYSLLPTILSANSSLEEILETKPQGIFLSNGLEILLQQEKSLFQLFKNLLKKKFLFLEFV